MARSIRQLVAEGLEGSAGRFAENRSRPWAGFEVADDINWAIFEGLSESTSIRVLEGAWLIVDLLIAGGIHDVEDVLRCAESVARSEVGR